MVYFLILDNENNVISKQCTTNPDELLVSNKIEVTEETYNSVFEGNFKYVYVDGVLITNAIQIPVDVEPDMLVSIFENLNMLIELQADLIGGAI